MGRGSVAQRLVDFVQGGVGSVRGSLGVTAVGTSAIFGAISGASAATVATVGRVDGAGDAARRLPGDLHRRADHRGRRHRRDHPAQHPDDRLRRGGGGIGGAALCRRRHSGPDDRGDDRALCACGGRGARISAPASRSTCRRFSHAAGRSLWALGAPVIILGGIYGGVFSPTEAAAVACVYAGARHRLRVPRARLARHHRSRRRDRAVHRPDPHHRRLRRRVRLAADRESGSGDDHRMAAVAECVGLDAAAGHQHPAAGGRLLPRSAVGDPAAQPAAGAAWSRRSASTPCISAS